MATLLPDGSVLLPFLPDWSTPPSRGAEWETAIAGDITGGEEAHSMKPTQDRMIEWTVVPYDGREDGKIQEAIEAALKAVNASVPLWGRALVLGAAGVAVGATVVPVAGFVPVSWLPAVGHRIYAAGNWHTDGGAPWQIWTVASVTPGVGGAEHEITITAGSSLALAGGAAAVWPLLSGRFEIPEAPFEVPTLGTYTMRVTEPWGEALEVVQPEFTIRWGRSHEVEDSLFPLEYGPGGVAADPAWIFDNLPDVGSFAGISRPGGYPVDTVNGPGAIHVTRTVNGLGVSGYFPGRVLSRDLATLRTVTHLSSPAWHSRFLSGAHIVKTRTLGAASAFKVENLTGSPLSFTVSRAIQTVTVTAAATFTQVNSRSVTVNLAAYDGAGDFVGASAAQYTPFLTEFTETIELAPGHPAWSQFLGTYGYGGPGSISATHTQTEGAYSLSHGSPDVLLSAPTGMSVVVEFWQRADFNPWEGYFWWAMPIGAPVPRAGDGWKDSSGTVFPMASLAELVPGGTVWPTGEINGYGFFTIHSDPMLRGLGLDNYRLFRSRDPIYGGDEALGPFVVTA